MISFIFLFGFVQVLSIFYFPKYFNKFSYFEFFSIADKELENGSFVRIETVGDNSVMEISLDPPNIIDEKLLKRPVVLLPKIVPRTAKPDDTKAKAKAKPTKKRKSLLSSIILGVFFVPLFEN